MNTDHTRLFTTNREEPPTWTILENEVPEGDWPLIEGAKSLGVPDSNASPDDPEVDKSTAEEPPEGGSSIQSTAAVSRSGASSYAVATP